MKRAGIFFIVSLLLLSIAYAHDTDFNATKAIIDSKVSCDQLTDTQLDAIGDYYFEQIHSGQAHEYMDQMMFGNNPDAEDQFNINLAKQYYCGQNNGYYGMMGGINMMGNYGWGMMGGYSGYGGMMGYAYLGIYSILYFAILLGLAILVWLWVIKMLKEAKKK